MRSIAKVLAYIIRHRNGSPELLVFDHVGMPEAGTQVPAGTVDPGELPEAAVQREIAEESGLVGLPPGRYIRCFEYEHRLRQELHQRHVFLFTPDRELPETWVHAVRSDGEDDGLHFRYYWLEAKQAIHTLAVDQGKYIPQALGLLGYFCKR